MQMTPQSDNPAGSGVKATTTGPSGGEYLDALLATSFR